MILLRSISFLAHNFLFVLAGLIGIGFLIGFHELGHFLFCKLFNIRTPSFSIGFGPRLFTKKIGETEFALSAIPLGGYVEIAGSDEMGQGDQKEAKAKDSRSFAVKPYYQKLLVMFGGILFNLIFAYFAFILLVMLGLPKNLPIIKTVEAESTAQKLGFVTGDRIIKVNDQEVADDLSKVFAAITSDNETILTIARDGQEITIPVAKKTSPDSLGITFQMIKTPGLSFIEAVKKGIALTNKYISGTAIAFKNIFHKGEVSGIQGPLSIISIIMNGIKQSFSVFLLLLALISINLAILNLIPLPILDGGQILYYTIEAIIRRPIPTKIREYIHIACWILVLGLIVYLSAQDIYRMAKPYLIKFLGK